MIFTENGGVELDGEDTDLCLDIMQIMRVVRERFSKHYGADTAEMVLVQCIEDSKRPEQDIIKEMDSFQKAAVKGFTKSRLAEF